MLVDHYNQQNERSLCCYKCHEAFVIRLQVGQPIVIQISLNVVFLCNYIENSQTVFHTSLALGGCTEVVQHPGSPLHEPSAKCPS